MIGSSINNLKTLTISYPEKSLKILIIMSQYHSIKNYSLIRYENGYRDFYTSQTVGYFQQSQVYGTLYLLFSMVLDYLVCFICYMRMELAVVVIYF